MMNNESPTPVHIFHKEKDEEADKYDFKRGEVYVSTSIYFVPDTKQVIYIEEGEERITRYIEENFDNINERMKQRGDCLAFVPTIIRRFNTRKFATYHAPFGNGCPQTRTEEITAYNILKPYIRHCTADEFRPCFIKYTGDKTQWNGEECYVFNFFSFMSPDECPLDIQVHDFIKGGKRGNSTADNFYTIDCYQIAIREQEVFAEYNFSEEEMLLIDEIRERIDKLRHHGIEDAVIKSLFKEEVKLSRLRITKDYRIILTDYGNIEIWMPVLSKAVFILFLNHPEGIAFKDLPDYHDELHAIYKKITNRVNSLKIERSLYDVTDPTKNSINEKCARIRGGFAAVIDTNVAAYYCVTGKRGEPKKITLPRNLVEYE